ncbi:hypothetical protein PGTUg99_021824 [Puccinia graminis f. sp. tritici]|uniref:Uncharacterized protein n=1 Tax=Puccinia graminis f. sp. tritici TaxID=56615 RepID=A0A5B0SM79_PUCGR|nr:hypothetical protein PGTUg99_021824 [Puccinia graminis f. sp. tritici]
MNTKESTPASAESANSSEKFTLSKESDHLPVHKKQLSTKPEEEDSGIWHPAAANVKITNKNGSKEKIQADWIITHTELQKQVTPVNIYELNFFDASSEYVSLAPSVNKRKVAPKKMFEIDGKIHI